MLFERLKKWMRGRTRFLITDCFPAELLDACVRRNVRLFDLTVSADQLAGSVSPADLDALRAIAESSGARFAVVRSTGLRAAVLRYRFRWGIPCGILCFCAVLAVLSSMLWTIEIRGLTCLKEEAMLEQLASCDVRIGSFLSGISCNELEAELERMDPRILRATVNLTGTRLYIEIAERELPLPREEAGGWANIYAAEDGLILKADYFAGVGHFKAGDAVVKGDLLASGSLPMPDGSFRFVKAQAEVIAETKTTHHAFVTETVSVERVTRVRDDYGLAFFALRLFPFAGKARERPIAGSRSLQTAGTVFPVGLLRVRRTEIEKTQLTLTPAQGKLLGLTQLAFNLSASTDFEYVTGRTIRCYKNRGVTLEADVICRKNIAVQMMQEGPDDAENAAPDAAKND